MLASYMLVQDDEYKIYIVLNKNILKSVVLILAGLSNFKILNKL